MIKFNCVPKHLCTLTRPGRAYMNPMLDTSFGPPRGVIRDTGGVGSKPQG